MSKNAGLWIDHRKAVIVLVTTEGEEILEINSNVEKQPGRIEGIRSTTPFESQKVKADDSQQRAYTGHINDYYDRVIAVVRDAASILIFGPGEAKGELNKLLEHAKYQGNLLAVETTDVMTNPQIAAKVRERFSR